MVVAALPLGEQQRHGPALPVADGVQLGVQYALGAADMAAPLFATGLLPCGVP